jgi:hypothetical protein
MSNNKNERRDRGREELQDEEGIYKKGRVKK